LLAWLVPGFDWLWFYSCRNNASHCLAVAPVHVQTVGLLSQSSCCCCVVSICCNVVCNFFLMYHINFFILIFGSKLLFMQKEVAYFSVMTSNRSRYWTVLSGGHLPLTSDLCDSAVSGLYWLVITSFIKTVLLIYSIRLYMGIIVFTRNTHYFCGWNNLCSYCTCKLCFSIQFFPVFLISISKPFVCDWCCYFYVSPFIYFPKLLRLFSIIFHYLSSFWKGKHLCEVIYNMS